MKMIYQCRHILGWGDFLAKLLFQSFSAALFQTFHDHLIICDVIINLQRSNMGKLSACEDLVMVAFCYFVV